MAKYFLNPEFFSGQVLYKVVMIHFWQYFPFTLLYQTGKSLNFMQQ